MVLMLLEPEALGIIIGVNEAQVLCVAVGIDEYLVVGVLSWPVSAVCQSDCKARACSKCV